MKIREKYTCPLEIAHDIMKGKWKPILLWQLGKGNASPSQLAKEIEGINQKMLLEQLKELVDCGAVEKKVYEGYPLKTEYNLTNRGKKLLEAISILQRIGMEIMKESSLIE